MKNSMYEYFCKMIEREHDHYVSSGLMTEAQYKRYRRNRTMFFDDGALQWCTFVDEDGREIGNSLEAQIESHDRHILKYEDQIREVKRICRMLIGMRHALEEGNLNDVPTREIFNAYEHPEIDIKLPRYCTHTDGVVYKTLNMHLSRAYKQIKKYEKVRKQVYREELLRRLGIH